MGKTASDKNNNRIIRATAMDALMDVYKNHQLLGPSGAEKKVKNSFGEISLRADIVAEEDVINTLRRSGIPIRVISEEHGVVNLGDKYLGILDGLDGTNRYVAYLNGDKNARYGTMFGIFKGLDPIYDDFIFSGIMEHPSATLFYLDNGKAFSKDLKAGSTSEIRASGKKSFDSGTRIIINDYYAAAHYQFVVETFINKLPKELKHDCLLSTAAHFADLVSGKVDLVLEPTRKGNLEFAAAYGLVKASGGVMLTLDGKSIGTRKYFTFGQERYVPIISASTLELAESVIDYLTKSN